MANACSFLQLRFPRSQNFSGISAFRCSNNSTPYRVSLPSTFASARPLKSWMESEDTKDSITSIVSPSLHYANIMFFRSAYNVQVLVDENEPEEALLRRFRREVSKAGVIPECKRRRFFENKQEEKKRKAREAGKRNRRRRLGPRFPSPMEKAAAAAAAAAAPKEKADEDDNWDMPEGNIPN
ncbi:hypothetical protein NE237_031996 [Protea cynaroides]|uniref:Ribosomal protein S21 n=1 Tax=Protea cynaroides TaxID=273540 RepID=A0A9Q0L3E2_9MAGN|nr:hypothetical protein NE237_031996 [Protea cynaroides]